MNNYSLFTKSFGSSIILILSMLMIFCLLVMMQYKWILLNIFLDCQIRFKKLEDTHYFLGLKVSKVANGIIIYQCKLSKDVLSEFSCSSTTLVATPLDITSKLTFVLGDFLWDPSNYRGLVRKFNFLQHTRPDLPFSTISKSVPKCSQIYSFLNWFACFEALKQGS